MTDMDVFLNTPDTSLLLAVTVGILLLITFWRFRSQALYTLPGPSSPWNPLGTFLQVVKKGITQYDIECAEKYGKTYGDWMGSVYSIVTTDADIIREVFVKEFKVFPNPVFQFKSPHDIQRNALPFIYDYPHWKAVRSIVTPTFSSGKLKRMSVFMVDSIDSVMKNVLTAADEGRTMEMKEIYGSYTMKVISAAAFGLDIDTQNEPNHPFIQNSTKAISEILGNRITVVAKMFPVLKPLTPLIGLVSRPGPSLQYLDSILTSTMKNRRETGDSKRKDLLQLLIEAKLEDSQVNPQDPTNGGIAKRDLSDIEIRAQAIVFMLAGYETTATTLSFMSYLLANHPDIQRRLCMEIDDVLEGKTPDYVNIQQLPYLEMCLHESMRLFPPILRLSRGAEEDISIKGHFISKGTGISVPVYVLHRDPEYWPNPDKFDPERFSPQNQDKNHPFALIPFSAGPRNCVGKRMALVAAKIAMATVLQKVSFEITAETQVCKVNCVRVVAEYNNICRGCLSR
ncbi:cytochrome P450 3A24-like [Liolophura sinensis]|uniref:cytochrome P450 3A24-like n=1 Tax=Liolophura sinensis TaxID=3198878 RepID=UPI003158EE6F